MQITNVRSAHKCEICSQMKIWDTLSIRTVGTAQLGYCAGENGLKVQSTGQEEGRTAFEFGDP